MLGGAFDRLPRSLRIAINRVEGVTRAMVSPEARKGGGVFSGQGAVVALGSTDNWLVKPQARELTTLLDAVRAPR